VNLADALNHYLSHNAARSNTYAPQDLYRFGRWVGWERSVAELTPSEVARYGEEMSTPGADFQVHLASVKEFLTFLKRNGMVDHSLAPHIRLSKGTKTALAKTQTEAEPIPMTARGHQVLSEELRVLKGQRGSVAETIRLAAADKDFSENAPLDAAREHQGKVEARIRELEELLRRAVISDGEMASKAGVARVGSTVVLQDLSGKELRYLLVDSSEADPVNGKISVVSPVGKAIVGHRPGDELEVSAPKGVLRYRVITVGK